MALHIADPEVSALMTEYAESTGMTKTEALRRLLRVAVAAGQRAGRKAQFRQVADDLVKKARKERQPAQSKAEADALF